MSNIFLDIIQELPSRTLHEILEFWKIPASRSHLLLRNNAANITLGAELTLLNSEGCFIHALQLALKDGIFSQRSVKDIIAILYSAKSICTNRILSSCATSGSWQRSQCYSIDII